MSEREPIQASTSRVREPTQAVLPSSVKGSVRDLVQAALMQAQRETAELNAKQPCTPSKAKAQAPVLETGHLEALRKIPKLTKEARLFLSAFPAMDMFVSHTEVQKTFTGKTAAVLLELKPHFQKLRVQCVQTDAGWAITRIL